MSSSLNDQELQKLVDGELDLPSTKRLLKLAESTPSHWREIAVSLVEDKLWQRSFQQADPMAHDAAQSASEVGASIKAETLPSTGASSASDSTEFLGRVPPQPESSATANPVPTCVKVRPWLTMAAGLLLAVGLGYLAGSRASFDNPPSVSNNAILADGGVAADRSVALPADAIELADLKAEYQLELTDAMGVGKSSVPLYSARVLNQLPKGQRHSLAATQLSELRRQQLLQSGYQFQQSVDYLSGRLQDGRSFVVPIHTVNVSSGQ